MEYNRTMVANLKEDKMVRKARKDATTRIVMLMNEYHALSRRYFANETIRKDRMDEVAMEINRNAKHAPTNVSMKIPAWLSSETQWKDDVENIHI